MAARTESFLSIEEEASDAFTRRLQSEWTAGDQAALESRIAGDAAYRDAYRRVDESWRALERHAESPELMAYREEAISYARRAVARRWLKPSASLSRYWRRAGAVAACMLPLAIAWQLSPYGYRPGTYRTSIGEQRTVELEDHSRITLDASTRLRVRFSSDARVIELNEGQAQFSVSYDSTRPFKVQVGDRSIVALGTVFTVEYVDRKVHVAMMEGRVAVADRSGTQGPPERDVELSAGEELRVSSDGRTTVTPKADIEAATAWRRGKIIFRTETLGEAIRRVNRYSSQQIEIDDAALASRHISGVFEAGDTRGFVNAIERYLPVSAEGEGGKIIKLRPK